MLIASDGPREAGDPGVPRRSPRAWIVLLACTAQFLVVLDVSLVTVAVPSIARSLGLDELSMSWVVSAYTVAFAAVLLTGGRLCDVLGAKRTFVLAGALFAATAVVGALSVSGEMLIVARAAQGVAAALLAPTSLTLLQNVPDPRARLRAVAAWSATSSVGGALGATLGGVLLLAWPWPAVLGFEAAAALVATVAAVFALPAVARGTGRAFDGIGAIALAVTIAAAIVALVETGTSGPAAATSWIALGAAVLGAIVVIVRRRRAPDASLLPPALLRQPRITAANLLILLVAMACFPLWYLLTLTLQAGHQLTPFVSGLLFLVPSAAVVLGSLAVPVLGRRLALRTILLVGTAIATCGLAGLALGATGGELWLGTVLPATAVALGMGLLFTTLTSTATQDPPAGTAGLAAGLVNTSRQVGSAIGLAVVTIAYANTASIVIAFAAAAAAGAVAVVVTVLVRRAIARVVSEGE
ncbi:MFS transporter [Agromyces silvae]|uniref:MFS transporter n=1 Tax=Agromyces silvae TaxID=3388266 RepID=UPI00280C272B|nr:MFS transporter [Agromyces protaetiae]